MANLVSDSDGNSSVNIKTYTGLKDSNADAVLYERRYLISSGGSIRYEGSLAIDYSYYFNNIMNTLFSIDHTLKNIDSDQYNHIERNKVIRLILQYSPYNSSTTRTVDSDSERTITRTYSDRAEKVFVEHETISGGGASGICRASKPIDYKRILNSTNNYRRGNRLDNRDSDYSNYSENAYEEPYYVLDLVRTTGQFQVGSNVSGSLSGFSGVIKEVIKLDSIVAYDKYDMTSEFVGGNIDGSSGDSILTAEQQRAIIVSSLKQSGSIQNWFNEILDPTTIPGDS